jgi:four helix bundle protein
MTSEQLRDRTMTFAVEVFTFAKPMFASAETRGVAGQLLDAATSTAANYRAASHARSPKEWRAKLGVVVEESDESVFWLIFIKLAIFPHQSDAGLMKLTDEAQQLTRIFGAALSTSRKRASN